MSAGTDSAVMPDMRFEARLPALREKLTEADTAALLVTNLANVRYLTGFTGSAAVLLVTSDAALLTTDGRYRTQASEQITAANLGDDVDLSIGMAGPQRDAVVALAKNAGSTRIGLEANSVSWAAMRRWADALDGADLVPTEGIVESLREVKDAGEIARVERAAQIADRALGSVLRMLGERRSEEEVALALDGAMRRLGAEDRAFETIVASGPNAAKPHARPSSRVIERGDFVVVDFGATFEGYRSDMTRTFCVGGVPSEDMESVFDVVSSAQSAGVDAVRAGVVAGDVDKVCRDRIEEAGFGDAFEHGTGHGVGLDIHEAPSVGRGSTAILRAGAVVTVEPGVYLAGVGGVRIEDTVVVTSTGCRPLTLFPKELAA